MDPSLTDSLAPDATRDPASRRATIDAFLAERRVALVGASSDPKDLSRAILRELVARGYEVVPVNRRAAGATFDGHPVVADLATAATQGVGAALFMVPPTETLGLLRAAHAAGIPKVWLHRGVGRGATHPMAPTLATQLGLTLVDGECPLMFFADAGVVHRLHRSSRGLGGLFPLRAKPRPSRGLLAVRIALALIAALVGINALVAGVSFALDPTGAGLGLRVDLLRAPFHDYLAPGLILAGVVGLTQVATALTILRAPARGAWLALAAGLILIGWIAGQWVFLTERFFLQPLCFGLGLLELALALGAWHLADTPLRADLPCGPRPLESTTAVSS